MLGLGGTDRSSVFKDTERVKERLGVPDKVLLLMSVLILPPNQIEHRKHLDENGT